VTLNGSGGITYEKQVTNCSRSSSPAFRKLSTIIDKGSNAGGLDNSSPLIRSRTGS
jgi:hypothetical protein